MADVNGVLADPQFRSLDPATQRQVLGRIDPTFSQISDQDYQQFMQRMNPPAAPHTAELHHGTPGLKGTPAVPRTFLGTLVRDMSQIPAMVGNFIQHPIDTIQSGVNSFLNMPETMASSFESGHPGEGAARMLELAAPKLGSPEDFSIPTGVRSVARPAWGFVKGAAKETPKAAARYAPTGIMADVVGGPHVAAAVGAGLALPDILRAGVQGAREATSAPGTWGNIPIRAFNPDDMTSAAQGMGPVHPPLSPIRPTSPPESITPFPAGKGTGTKYGGPTAPSFSPPRRLTPGEGFTPPEGGGFTPQSIPPVETPPADYKFTPSPKTAKLMNRGGSASPSTIGVGKAPHTSRWSPSEGGGYSPTTMTPGPNRVSPIVTPTGAAQPATTGAPSSHVLTDISGRTVSVDPDIPEWMGIAQQKSAAVIGRHQYNKSVAMAEQAFGEPGMTPAKIRAMSADKLNAFIQRTMDPRTGRPYSAAEEVLSSGRPGRTTSMIREHAALALEDILRKAGGK